MVANFVSSAFDISTSFRARSALSAAATSPLAIALLLYPFTAPWEGDAAHFVNAVSATMGPLLGIIVADWIARGQINVRRCTGKRANTATRWLERQRIDARREAVFSHHPAQLHDAAPAWWELWLVIGVAIRAWCITCCRESQTAP